MPIEYRYVEEHELVVTTFSGVVTDEAAALTGLPAEMAARIGEVFEVHPEVLENWHLGHPVVIFSLTLGAVEYC